MTNPKRSPGAHDICIHPDDMHRHTCHSQTTEMDSADAASRRDSRATCMYVLIHAGTQCFCLYALMWEATHTSQSKQICHWWDNNAQGACTSMPMLTPRALNYSLAETSRMGHWQGQNPPTTRRAQPSEQLRHAAMLSLQKHGTARKPKMRAEPPRVWHTEGHNDKTAHN